jgi:uncharacterized peroxidase-related enzyme
MPRLKIVTPESSQGKARELLDSLLEKSGKVINIFRGLANSPVALEAYLTLDRLIEEGSFSPQEQQLIRLVVSQFNGCDYCLAAHTLGGKKTGLTSSEMRDIRTGTPRDPRYAALVSFTRRILETRGFIDDADIEAFRAHGYNDSHIAEVVTVIAQKTLSNYFNHINETDLDLSPAPDL